MKTPTNQPTETQCDHGDLKALHLAACAFHWLCENIALSRNSRKRFLFWLILCVFFPFKDCFDLIWFILHLNRISQCYINTFIKKSSTNTFSIGHLNHRRSIYRLFTDCINCLLFSCLDFFWKFQIFTFFDRNYAQRIRKREKMAFFFWNSVEVFALTGQIHFGKWTIFGYKITFRLTVSNWLIDR